MLEFDSSRCRGGRHRVESMYTDMQVQMCSVDRVTARLVYIRSHSDRDMHIVRHANSVGCGFVVSEFIQPRCKFTHI